MLHCSQEASLNLRPPMLCAWTIADHDPRIGAPRPDPAVWIVGPRVGKWTPREQINDQMTWVGGAQCPHLTTTACRSLTMTT
jgi:hypothetical protein